MNSIPERISEIKAQIEDARQFGPDGLEYWSARTLAPVLGYRNWEQVPSIIERASLASENTGSPAANHFRPASKMMALGKGASREVLDFHMSRYGCYLFAMNGDPRKVEISCAQSYFAARTHEAEVRAALPAPIAPALPTDPIELLELSLRGIQQTRQDVRVLTARLDNTPISMHPEQEARIYSLCQELGRVMPGGYRAAYRVFKAQFGQPGAPLAKYTSLPIGRFDEAVHFLTHQTASYRTGDLFEDGAL